MKLFKGSVVVFSFLFLLNFFPSQAFAENLLSNPGFEEGITAWTLNGTTATFSAVSDTKHSGSHAASLSKKNTSSWAYFYQRANIEAGKYYKLSGWVRSYDDYINNIKLRFYWLSDSLGTKATSSPTEIVTSAKNSDFQFLQTESSLAPDNALFAEIQGYTYLSAANPTNPSLFDDLSFEEAPLPTPTPTVINTPTPTNTPTPIPTRVPTQTPVPTPTPIAEVLPTSVLGESTESADYELLSNTKERPTIEKSSGKETKILGEKTDNLPKILIGLGGLLLLICAILTLRSYTRTKRLFEE